MDTTNGINSILAILGSLPRAVILLNKWSITLSNYKSTKKYWNPIS